MSENWSPSDYIDQRVKQYQGWYDAKAVVAKRRYLRMRGFSVVAGGIVPVLINVPEVPYFGELPIVQILVTLLSLLVVVFVSLEGVLHYREQWKNYRSTEQLLGHDIVAFKSRIGPFKGLSDEDAFETLVERVEEAIRAENSATLNVMTMANDASETAKGYRT